MKSILCGILFGAAMSAQGASMVISADAPVGATHCGMKLGTAARVYTPVAPGFDIYGKARDVCRTTVTLPLSSTRSLTFTAVAMDSAGNKIPGTESLISAKMKIYCWKDSITNLEKCRTTQTVLCVQTAVGQVFDKNNCKAE